MQTITEILTDIVSAAFVKCGSPDASGVVTASDRLDLCQFQCNGAFAAAKLIIIHMPVLKSPEAFSFIFPGSIWLVFFVFTSVIFKNSF